MTQPQLKAKIPTMSITVQFFASLREQVGKQQATLPYEVPVDVSTVWTKSTDNMDMPDNTLCAINMEYVNRDAMVSNGDEVAFFPPVTGG
jgi:molybdopterin synthase sulfur carrier subunit